MLPAPTRLAQADSPNLEEHSMAAMKPRTATVALEATKEGRGIVMRVPLRVKGRLVVELTRRKPPRWVTNSERY